MSYPDDPCEECGLPFWVCQEVAREAIRRGGIDEHRRTVEDEYRAGTWVPRREDYDE
jgi:hypothetical protein